MPLRKKGAPKRGGGIPAWLILALMATAAVLYFAMGLVEKPEKQSAEASSAVAQGSFHAIPVFPETPPEERVATAPPEVEKAQIELPSKQKGTVQPIAAIPDMANTISIVLDDVGYQMDLIEVACRVLPPEVTFAILPYLPHAKESAEYLHLRGYPVIMHAPMEPLDGGRWKPGPGALYAGMPESEIAAIMQQDLLSVPYAEGVNNHMGSRATTDMALMLDLMSFLKRRNLYFLDSRTTTHTVAYQAAKERGVPTAQKFRFLDDENRAEAIITVIDTLARSSAGGGPLVGIGHLRAQTVKALAERLPYWKSRGIKLVPLKEVVR